MIKICRFCGLKYYTESKDSELCNVCEYVDNAEQEEKPKKKKKAKKKEGLQ